MQLISTVDDIPGAWRGAVVALGTFDGIHTGHQAVARRLAERAAEASVPGIVVLVDPPSSAALADLDQRAEALRACGVDGVVAVGDRDRGVAVVGHLDPSLVVAGEGDDLAHLGAGAGVERVGTVLVGGAPVSADAVRAALDAGDVAVAGGLLGRPFAVRGRVEHGDQRGRELGFPTANVAVDAGLALPADGVYGGRYRRPDGSELVAAISLGRRPTFYDDGAVRLVEPHLLDFAGDLYGEGAEVVFDVWIRGQVRFGGVDELVAQMRRDVATVRAAVPPGQSR